MSILLFIIILGVLIFVHELGHFLFAKWTGMRVHKFAIGFPPNLWSHKRGETTYEINAIPFGGYVKIEGENHEADQESAESDRSFNNKSWWQQSIVLLAGIVFNILLAWIALSATLAIGVPAIYDGVDQDVVNPALTVLEVLPESPADEAGLLFGDQILALTSVDGEVVTDPSISRFQEFSSRGEKMTVSVFRGGEEISMTMQPEVGLLGSETAAIGIALDMVGTKKFPIHKALIEGVSQTASLTKSVAIGLTQLIGDAFTGDADLDDVSGPIGIVSLVSDAQNQGFVAVLLLLAIISINLALLNLVPFPALDGGRLIFVWIESITGRRIPAKTFATINGVGFFILMLLMVLVTVNDVGGLF